MRVKRIETIEELKNKKISKERETVAQLKIGENVHKIEKFVNNDDILIISEINEKIGLFDIHFIEVIDDEIIEKYKNFLKKQYYIFFDNLDNFIMSENSRDFGIELFARNTILEFTKDIDEIEILEKFLKI